MHKINNQQIISQIKNQEAKKQEPKKKYKEVKIQRNLKKIKPKVP